MQSLRAEVSGWTNLLQELAQRVKEQEQELRTMRKDVALLLSELGETKTLLLGINKELTEITDFNPKSE